MSRENHLPAPYQGALARLGRLALERTNLDELLHESASLVAKTLGVEFCKILELLPDRRSLLLRAGVGWKEGLVGRAVLLATSDTHAGHSLVTGAPVIVEDVREETKFQMPPWLQEHGITSGVSMVIPGAEPFGVLGVHTSACRSFSAEELAFLDSVIQVLSRAIHRLRSDEALRQSEEHFRRVFEDSPIGMAIIGLDRRLLRGNRAICKLLSYSEEEFKQLTVEQITHSDDLAKSRELSDKLRSGEISGFRLEKRYLTKSGEPVWAKVTVTLLRDEQGNPLHAVAMIEDISAQRERERDLRLARHSIDNAQEAILWTDSDGRFTAVNDTATRLLGYSRDEFLGMKVLDLDANLSPGAWSMVWESATRAGARERESLFRAKEGHLIPVELTLNHFQFNGTEYVCAFARDITDRRRALEELKASEERYRNLFENSAAMVWMIDMEGNVTSVNRAAETFSGYERQELVGRNIATLLPADQLQLARGMIEQKLRGEEATSYDLEIITKDARRSPMNVTSCLILEHGKPVGIQGIGVDVSEQRRAEAALRRSEEYFRALIENSLDVITILDADGTIRYVSPSIERVLGYGVEERVGRNTFEIIHPEDAVTVKDAIAQGIKKPGTTATLECRVRHADGSWRYLELEARNLLDNTAVAGLIVNSRDNTQRKLSELALQRNEKRFRAAAESASDFIYEWDIRSGRVEWHGDVDAAMRYRHGEFPRTFEDLKAVLHPEDRRRLEKTVERVHSSGARRCRDLEVQIKAKAGGYRHWVVRGRCDRDEAGQPSKWIGACSDITRRKQAEQALRGSEAALRSSQEELRALAGRLLSDKEDEHRRLARELHDDFNQRVTAVAFDLAGLEEEYPPDVPAKLKKRLRTALDRVERLSDDMRRLAHQLHPAAVELLGLPAALREQCQEVSRPGRMHVRFTSRKLPESFPADIALCLYRVAQESLRNVVKHSRADKVSVTLSGSPQGVRLSIKDNGGGFDTGMARKKGGLGLVSMKERVRLAGGTLTIKSTPGQGTRVVVEVPVGNSPPRY